MVTEIENVEGLHIKIAPNASLNSSQHAVHVLWVAGIFIIASSAFFWLGLWPVSIVFMTVWLGLVVALEKTYKKLHHVERIDLEKGKLNFRLNAMRCKCQSNEALIRVYEPLQEWAPLQFELSVNAHSVIPFANLINREDGERLCNIIRAHDINYIRKRYVRDVVLEV